MTGIWKICVLINLMNGEKELKFQQSWLFNASNISDYIKSGFSREPRLYVYIVYVVIYNTYIYNTYDTYMYMYIYLSI